MEIRDLDDWKAYCLRAATRSVDRDRAILRSGWAAESITPPPALEDPNAHIPLERARELECLARGLEDDEPADDRRRRHLSEAIAWLEYPHPCASPLLRAAMRRTRRGLEERLHAVDPEPA